ncbi:spore germination protein [Alkalibaculum sp. M08DMB]|uniref:Spore germination protein n=1 Tax=Alkalibaculum sporogenes TaxID=2655001 RepID=A0A6A7K8D4_9FIRM|nr:spore germination protein [Alkalibaculum sporogenes]MPW25467.1 spore germination protein [Alkalibaculum sporogenes]
MFNYLKKIIHYKKAITKHTNNLDDEKDQGVSLTSHLDENLNMLKNILGNSNDIIIKLLNIGNNHDYKGALVYIDGLVDKTMLYESIMRPLQNEMSCSKDCSNLTVLDRINERLLSSTNIDNVSKIKLLIDNILTGNTVLLLDGSNQALAIPLQKWEKRSIEQPVTESVVRGPHQGFTETISTNITLLRRIIKNPDLRMESYTIGDQTNTNVCIVYMKDIVNPKLITEINTRLDRIKTDAILESGYIEAFIEDAPYSIFATVGNCEKPDKVASKILEGRAAIFVDGSPFVLTVPLLFIENFQSTEDYYSRPYFSSMTRLLRFVSYFITILSPGIYVALTTYHQELIPTQLLFTMAAGQYGIPFPSAIETLIMLIIFDILREAGIRLPKPVGSAVSIVGALVLGESAVSAGLISPFMVIIVALTAISSFVISSQTDSAAILRYFFLLLAGLFGAFGLIMGFLFILVYLASLRSFGTPYLLPISPLSMSGMKDTFIRAPIWAMLKRPKTIGKYNLNRQTESYMKPTENNRNINDE